MPSVSQVIAGEWFEVRERVRRPREIWDIYAKREGPSNLYAAARQAVSALDRSIERGVSEYKRRAVMGLLQTLEDAAYTSDIFQHLAELRLSAAMIVLVAAVQRALVAGDIVVRQTVELDAPPSEAPVPIKDIMADVQAVVAADPAARTNPHFKNILLQLAKYRQETETYKKLTEQASPERREGYRESFATTFADIFESIRRNYTAFNDERDASVRGAPTNPADPGDRKAWVKHLTHQLEALSDVHGTLVYAASEHSGVREPLVALAKRRDEIIALLDEEGAIAATATGGEEQARKQARTLGSQVSKVLTDWAAT